MNKKGSSPLGVGIITIFIILVILCLTTFAVLTLSSARADLRLSHINADTVTAYYEADARAAGFYADFKSGSESELEKTLPITDTQSLYLHLARREDGGVAILAWQVIASNDELTLDDALGVWDGSDGQSLKGAAIDGD
ncbi:hypothetical protein SDC9_70165 [bioreactor metagenome]|uniref:Type 4 fimbrial biogenesis protein PilX N-terminal domain-containing protein n=1 Tax=bioreactor metagenome TaxID=1076179 RepID=A0A644Y6X5_9ZZZZ